MAPAARAGKLLDAAAQSAKAHDARRLPKLGAEFVAQAREEKQFQAVGGFVREPVEVGFDGALRMRFDGAGADGKPEIAQRLFNRLGKFADGDDLALKFSF